MNARKSHQRPQIAGLLRISIEMAAFLALFSIDKAAVSVETRSTVAAGDLAEDAAVCELGAPVGDLEDVDVVRQGVVLCCTSIILLANCCHQ